MVFYWIKQAFDTPVCEEDVFPNDDIESFIKVTTELGEYLGWCYQVA